MGRTAFALITLTACAALVVGCSTATGTQSTGTQPAATQSAAATSPGGETGTATSSGIASDPDSADASADTASAPTTVPAGESNSDAAAGEQPAAPAAGTAAAPVAVPAPANAGSLIVGYFTDWGIYDRGYFVSDIEKSGSADKLTHILYAFGNVEGGKCKVGDSWADHDKAFSADEALGGIADSAASLAGDHGNFAQLKKLKALHPGLKVLWSFGGWTWSAGFPEAAANAEAFAESCYNVIHDPRWDGLFDGMDVDWEYPNECGMSCDETSGRDGYSTLIKALRARFGPDEILTSAIGAGVAKLDAADYAEAAPYLNFFMPMTYDYFGAWSPTGPTAPHSPLTSYDGQPEAGFDSATSIDHLLAMGIPANKLLLGLGFYGHGWMGVTDAKPGGAAKAPARGTYESGTDDYKVLKKKCPPTGTVGGTAYGFCNGEWWGYDTPETIAGKMAYVKSKGLAGSFFWELSGDTADGELITAMAIGLK